MDSRELFRAWKRFFLITTLLGGPLALAVSIAIAFVISLLSNGANDPNMEVLVGGLIGYAIGFGLFAWISCLTYCRVTQTLMQRVGNTRPTSSGGEPPTVPT